LSLTPFSRVDFPADEGKMGDLLMKIQRGPEREQCRKIV
jgi:hypothetical protein